MLSELKKYVEQSIENMINNIHTAIPCEVVSYDAEKNEATLKPYGNFYTPYGDIVPYPEVSKVPFMFWQSIAQKSTIIYPINPGDECLLLFAERTLEQWKTKAGAVEVDLRFDLSNAFAIVGLFAKPNELAKRAQENQSIIIQRHKTFVEIYDGQVEMLVKDDEININSYHAFIDGKSSEMTFDVKNIEEDDGEDRYTLNAKINGNNGEINVIATNVDENEKTIEFNFDGKESKIDLIMSNPYENDRETIILKADGRESNIDLAMKNPEKDEQSISIIKNGRTGAIDIETKGDSGDININAHGESGELNIDTRGNVNLTSAKNVDITAMQVNITADVNITGKLTLVNEDVVLNAHKHGGVETGGGVTNVPQN